MRGDMGIATLIIFVVIILVATVAAVIIIQATNAVKNQAQSTSEESRSKLGKRLVPDMMYIIVDQNRASPNYKKAVALWIQAKVPKYGSVVDLRKTFLSIKTENSVIYAKYIDADGDEVYGDNACDTTSPFPTNDPTNPGNVEYNALNGDVYTVVWLNCDGKNEDYLVYPGQLVMLVYAPKHPFEEEEEITITIKVQDGGEYTFTTVLPTFTNERVMMIRI